MNDLFTLLIRTLSASMSAWLVASACWTSTGFAQSSSLFQQADAGPTPPAAHPNSIAEIQQTVQADISYFAVQPLPRRVFKVGDLITVIVRHQSSYKHDGKTDLKRALDVEAQLRDWIRIRDGRLGPEIFPDGNPAIGFDIDEKFKTDGKVNRTNEVITRITCKIIDVLPNGSLVIQGGPDIIETDGERQTITLTGTCRNEDVLADNTILSTQLLEVNFYSNNSGAVRDSMKRGWIHRAWDFVRPL